VPVSGLTRREQSVLIASTGAPGLPRRADSQVFGPAQPAVSAAESFWRSVDDERRALSAGVSRRRRILGALSLRTFWRR